jgi:hypothetical protein
VELLLIAFGMALFGLLAARYGHDSRDVGEAGPWHSWREASARSRAGAGGRALHDPSGLAIVAAQRGEELRLIAAQARLGRPLAATRVDWVGTGLLRGAASRAGAAMVRAGERLQEYGRTAAPGW